jgi:hypothetical protein
MEYLIRIVGKDFFSTRFAAFLNRRKALAHILRNASTLTGHTKATDGVTEVRVPAVE